MDRDRSGSRVPHFPSSYVEVDGSLVEVEVAVAGGVTKGEAVAVAILVTIALVALVILGTLP